METKLVWGNKRGKEFDMNFFGCKNGPRQSKGLGSDMNEAEIISRDFKPLNSKTFLFDS